MYYLTAFKHFVSIFSLIFDPIDPLFIDFRSFWSNWPLFHWSQIILAPFSLISDHFDSSFLQNLRPNWVQFFIECWTQQIWWSTLSPRIHACVCVNACMHVFLLLTCLPVTNNHYFTPIISIINFTILILLLPSTMSSHIQ